MDFAALLRMGVDTSDLIKGEDALDRLADAGAITERRLDGSMDRIAASTAGAAGQVGVAARKMDGATRAATQNLTYQFNDIAQMLAAGQNPFMLAMQQGGQVAGAIDQLKESGGVLRGIGGAFMSMLSPISLATFGIIGFGSLAIQWLTGTGDAARTTQDAIKDLAAANKELQNLTKYFEVGGIEAMTEEYGSASAEVRELIDLQRQLAEMTALNAAREAMSNLMDETDSFFGGVAVNLDKLFGQGGTDFGFALEQSMRRASEALTLEDQLVQVTNIRQQIEAATSAAGGMNAEQRAFLSTVVSAEAELRRTITTQNEIAAAAEQSAQSQEKAATSAVESAQSQEKAATSAVESALKSAEAMTKSADAVASISTNWENFAGIVGQDMAGIVGPFTQAMTDIKSSADEAARAIPASIASAVEGMRSIAGTARQVGLAIGAETINGFVAGVAAGRSRLVSASQSMAATVNKTFRDALQIRSPSRVFRSHGNDVGEGLRLGLEDSRDGLESTMGDLAGGIGDAVGDLFTGAFDSAKDFLGAIKDAFKRTLSELISMAVANPIRLALGIGGGGLAAGAVSGGGGLLGGGGGLLGGFGSAGGILGFGGLGGGTGLLGGLGNALSGGLGNILNIGANAAAAGGGILASIGAALPILGAVGLVFGLFRKKVKELDSGLRVTIEGMDAVTETFRTTETKRFFGLSRKVGTRYSAASGGIADPVQAAISQIGESVVSMAEVLGQDGSRILRNFSTQLTVSTKGMTDEQASRAIQEAMQGVSDEMAKQILKSSYGMRFVREGESFSQTLTRLSTSLASVNSALGYLGHSMLNVSMRNADAASRLVDAFGGLDAMAAASQSYFQNFYGPAEQLELRMDALTRAFGDANVRMPETMTQFRRMVEAQDLTTQRGRHVYATLLSLSGEFAELDRITRELTGATRGLSDAARQELQSLRDQRALLRARIEGADAVRELELSRLQSDAARLVQEQIYRLTDRLERMAEAARAADAALREREGLEMDLLRLQGNTAAIRRRELAALVPANRALQRMIYRIEDARTAADAARDAFRESADAERNRISELRDMSSAIRDMAGETMAATFGVSEAQRRSAERQLRTAIQTGRVWDSSLQGLAETAMAVDEGNFGSSVAFLRASARAAGVLAAVANAQDAQALSAEGRLEAALERYGLQEPVVLGMTAAMNRLTSALDRLGWAEGMPMGARIAALGPASVGQAKAADDAKTAQRDLEELKGYMRELVKINLRQERTLKEIELQGEA